MVNYLFKVISLLLLLGTSSAGATSITKTLVDLGASYPIKLDTTESGYTVKIPMSPREQYGTVKLHLEATNSTALIKSRSALSIRVNGSIIKQQVLDPLSTKQIHDIEIPRQLLKTGFNDVFIKVDQHYTYQCEDPASPELWTELDTLRSTVSVDVTGAISNTAPTLSQLRTAFDSRTWIPRPISVILGADSMSEDDVSSAGLIAQGLALRKEFRATDFNVVSSSDLAKSRGDDVLPGVSNDVLSGSDAIIVGSKSSIAKYISNSVFESIKGPFVGVVPGANGKALVLVVSGNNSSDVKLAATAIADNSFRFPDAPFVAVTNASIPPLVEVNAAEDTAMSAFNWKSQSSKGFKAPPIYFEFRAPADYGANKGDQSTLSLHMAYGAGLRQDSSIVIYLNGKFATSVLLNQESGAELKKYEIKIPSEYVRPGINSLSFQPVFIGKKFACDMVRDEGFIATIYDDSTLKLSSATSPPQAPDLLRFSRSFWSVDSLLRVYLTDRSPDTVSAYLNFAGLIAQKNKAAIDTSVQFDPYSAGHMLIVGSHSKVEPNVAKSLALDSLNWEADGDHVALLQGVESSRVVTAFVGKDSSQVTIASKALLEQGLWNAIEGDASIIDLKDLVLISRPAKSLTDFGTTSRAAGILSSSIDWKYIATAIGILIILISAVFSRILRSRSHARQNS